MEQQLLELFRAEAAEHFQRMDEALLALEREEAPDAALAALFRSAHTLKGSARVVGLTAVGELAHRLEDLLDALRSRGPSAIPQAAVEALFRGRDLLGQLLHAGGPEPAEQREFLAQLAALAGELPRSVPAAGSDAPAVAAAPAAAGGGEPAPPAGPAPASKLSPAAVQPTGPAEPVSPPPRAPAAPPAASVRLGLDRAERLLSLAGELVSEGLSQGAFRREVRALESSLDAQRAALSAGDVAVADRHGVAAAAAARSLRRRQGAQAQHAELLRELYDELTSLRMQPARQLFAPFGRVVRDVAHEQGKEVRLETAGESVQLDQLVIEALRDPLVHLVRNAVGHGIEPPEVRIAKGKPRQGLVRLVARQRATGVALEVEDDGAGIDWGAVVRVAVARGLLSPDSATDQPPAVLQQILFRPGFSTASEITGISGRGVGLDVVATQVRTLKGSMAVHTTPGLGTRFVLTLPATLAFTRLLLVGAGGQRVAVPSEQVRRVEPLPARARHWAPAGTVAVFHGMPHRVASLARLAGWRDPGQGTDRFALLLATSGEPADAGTPHLAAEVDQVWGEETVILKPPSPLVGPLPHVSGMAILADGRGVVVLDVEALWRRPPTGGALGPAGARQTTDAEAAPPPGGSSMAPPRILVVDDALTTRELLRGLLAAAGYEVSTAVDGVDALQQLSAGGFACAVVDVEMPGMDGIALTQHLRQQPVTAELPVVIVSAREGPEDRRRGLEAGAQAYVGKGTFSQEQLLEVIARVVGAPPARRALGTEYWVRSAERAAAHEQRGEE